MPKQFTLRTLLLASALVAAFGAAYREDVIREQQLIAGYVDKFVTAFNEQKYDDVRAIAKQARLQFPDSDVMRGLAIQATLVDSFRGEEIVCFGPPAEYEQAWEAAMQERRRNGLPELNIASLKYIESSEEKQAREARRIAEEQEWLSRIERWNAQQD